MTNLLAATALIVATLFFAGASGAAADNKGGCSLITAGATCTVNTETELEGDKNEPGPSGGGAGGQDSGSGALNVMQQQLSDYCEPANPPAGHPDWQGHDPSEGTLLACPAGSPPCLVGSSGGCVFFVPNGESPETVVVVDPRVLAQQARDELQLETANAQIAPEPPHHTYIRYENWMWLDESQFEPLKQSVSLAGTSVTVTAEPTRVEWDMGPETVICPDAGREWRDTMPEDAPTTCSYAYETLQDPTGDVNEVSAQIRYHIAWTCSGVCTVGGGDFGEVLAPAGEPTTIDVRQRQVVNIG